MSFGKMLSAAALCNVMFTDGAGADTPTLSTFGTPGIVELPSAGRLNDGELGFSVATTEQSLRNTATFQVFPRVYGSFRYSIIDKFSEVVGTRFDRSFDVHFSLLDETETRPALAFGLRDFLGTGVYSSEYLVATKNVTDTISLTGGIGWGRLAGRNTFDNPLAPLGFDESIRDTVTTGQGGQLEVGKWLQGPASFFWGVDWDVTDKVSVQLEYSPDLYGPETVVGAFNYSSPVNVAVQYKTNFGLNFRGFVIAGENFGVQFGYVFDAKEQVIPGGREPAPYPIIPRRNLATASWNVDGPTGTVDVLRSRLGTEGLALAEAEISPTSATIFIRNNRWNVEAQAAGRAARVMANTLPPQIEDFTVIFQERGVPISSIATKRADLEELQYVFDAAWRTRARADVSDANRAGVGAPQLTYSLTPYSAFSFFDPQSPIRVDIGPQLDIGYQAAPGLTLDARFRYPLVGNLGDGVLESDSVIERVRSESFLFARESDFEVNLLTAEYLWRPSADVFARVTGGYLENQFGGVSAEMLWSPIDSRLALGAELNYVRQRNFDMLLGFQDYDVVTGHTSVYYDLGSGFHTQLDLGRYLAGDWGGTLTVNREFNNGVKVGGYFTLTDVPFADFGEGAFDKGLRVEIPLTFVTGQPSRRVLSQAIQPIQRDGGARLNVENRLYPLTRDYRGAELTDGWGRYLR
ncbi:YjbH domain-containing protein [Loktanella sp. F6476L]|uniref:YjbH domain-containing protein n=1 Tax=Loktanella sp. F6476L TaxID=2926405 RepID=UPI001FF2C102|nr:YjbH domain-containing protein [Loktanella sp. F6476L]MCK0122415.1 YjbH domain-containing protein [Loktanella sp. F6476L]